MNSKFVLVAALAAGAIAPAALAQTTGSQIPSAPGAPAAAPAPPPPEAIPAKIALIELTEVAAATNEGEKSIDEIQKKYAPQKAKLDALQAQIASQTKELQNAPATMTEEERTSRSRTIDTEQKQLQRDGDDASSAYSAEVQEAIAKVEGKLGPVVVKYVRQNGYTMLLDNTGQPQQGGLNILWGGTDISEAVVEEYNKTSGIAAPMPSAPSAARPRSATPRSAAPKQ